MALTKEEVIVLKSQLKQQIQHLPPEKKAEAEKQIESLSPEALETMLLQQKQGTQPQEIFRKIIKGEIPSKKIDENKESIAVLDIKPISEGHTLIIPKNKVIKTSKMPSQAFSLAKSVSSRIISRLKAVSTEIQTEFKFGEIIINVIPIYNEPLNILSPRNEISENDLEKTYQKLKKIKKLKIKREKIAKTNQSSPLKLPKRIP